MKEVENSEIASSNFFTTCVDDAMELSDSINEEVHLTAATLSDQNAVLTHSSNSHRIKTLNTDQDTSNDSLGECSMEDSVKNDSGLFSEPPPEFVNSTADLSQRDQELSEEIAPDEGQNDAELMELTKPEQDRADLIVAEAVGSECKNDLDQEDLEIEKEKESHAADEEEISESWFIAKIFEEPSYEKVIFVHELIYFLAILL